MNAIAQRLLKFISNTTCVRKLQLQRGPAFHSLTTDSQIKSPALLRLRDSLRVELGGVLVFTSPFGSGKTTVLKDLTALLRRNDTFVAYVDCRRAKGFSSATEFVYAELGLTKEAAREDLGPLLPISASEENKTTIILDHFEDLMHLYDSEVLVRSWARETYEMPLHFRVLLCVAPENRVLKVLDWNGGSKIRLAIWPLAARWTNELLMALLDSQHPAALSLEPNEKKELESYITAAPPLAKSQKCCCRPARREA